MDIDILKADGACDGYEGGHDTDHWDLLMISDMRHLVTWYYSGSVHLYPGITPELSL